MLPFRLVAALRQEVHAAHQIPRVEVLRVYPLQQGHVLVLRPQCRRHLARTPFVHVIEEAADEIGDQIGAQGPARPEVSEDPGHVGHAAKHHAAIGDRVGEDEGFTVDAEFDVAQHAQIEAGRGHDDVRFEKRA